MGIADRSDSRSPERKDEVILLLALAYFSNGIGIERLVCMVIGIELEKRLPPVMTAIALGKVFVCQDVDVFSALQVTILMPVMDHLMAPVCHHLGKLDHLLRVGTSIKLLACNCVRQP